MRQLILDCANFAEDIGCVKLILGRPLDDGNSSTSEACHVPKQQPGGRAVVCIIDPIV